MMRKYTKVENSFLQNTMRRGVLVLVALAMAVGIAWPALADEYDQKIQQLQSQVSADQQNVEQLQGRANDLNAQIAQLQHRIASTQAQIDLNQKKFEDLNQQITIAEEELAHQRKILGTNIKVMYLEGKISTVEMLASSKNISDYLDKQEYRNAVKDKVTETVKKIADLKKELNEKRDQVAALLEDQRKLKADLDSKQAEASALLGQTNADRKAFEDGIESKRSEIAKLRAEQAAANAAHGGIADYTGTTSYPWAHEGFPCSGGDPWGMCFRQCVSYAAWKTASIGRYMPNWGYTGSANARDWPVRAQQNDIPYDTKPKEGDVAIGYWGPYGHAMFVEKVLPNNQIYVSQYNYEVQGLYSEMVVSTDGLLFIHFPKR